MSDSKITKPEDRFKSRTGPMILGIDPGTRRAGFAFLQARIPRPLSARDFRIIDAGIIRLSPKDHINQRLGLLHKTVLQLVEIHLPDYCVIEKAFYGVNAQTTLRLGEARGACLSAFYRTAATVNEMSPNHMKKAITGRGHASKEEVAFAVKQLLQFDRKELPLDVTDALALALSFGLGLAAGLSLASQKSTGFSSLDFSR